MDHNTFFMLQIALSIPDEHQATLVAARRHIPCITHEIYYFLAASRHILRSVQRDTDQPRGVGCDDITGLPVAGIDHLKLVLRHCAGIERHLYKETSQQCSSLAACTDCLTRLPVDACIPVA